MAFDVSGNTINAAIVSGISGLRNASQGITEASVNIANRNAQARTPEELLSDAAVSQVGLVNQILPQGGDTLTNDLVSLSVNSINAQAATKVIDTVDETVGRLIDILA